MTYNQLPQKTKEALDVAGPILTTEFFMATFARLAALLKHPQWEVRCYALVLTNYLAANSVLLIPETLFKRITDDIMECCFHDSDCRIKYAAHEAYDELMALGAANGMVSLLTDDNPASPQL